ncbi:hypothetical protein HK101_009432, partial [Irineochytrium annulatum]
MSLGASPQMSKNDVVYLSLRDNVRFCVTNEILSLFPDSVLVNLFPAGLIQFFGPTNHHHRAGCVNNLTSERSVAEAATGRKEREEAPKETPAIIATDPAGGTVEVLTRKASAAEIAAMKGGEYAEDGYDGEGRAGEPVTVEVGRGPALLWPGQIDNDVESME